jgi:two-component system, response regulator
MLKKVKKSFTILVADDDPDDLILIRDAFDENSFEGEIQCVNDGEELLDYLNNRGKYIDPDLFPKPDLILLDLNMPRKDGREALAEIKADPNLKILPIVVLTTSNSVEDIIRSYNLGANSYIIKPMTFNALTKTVGNLGIYWFKTAKLPSVQRNNG